MDGALGVLCSHGTTEFTIIIDVMRIDHSVDRTWMPKAVEEQARLIPQIILQQGVVFIKETQSTNFIAIISTVLMPNVADVLYM